MKGKKFKSKRGSKSRAVSRSLSKNQKQEVKKLIQKEPELKWAWGYNTALAGVGIGTVPIVAPSTVVSQGVAANKRVGDKIRVRSIKLDMTFSGDASASLVPDFVNNFRFILFRWHPLADGFTSINIDKILLQGPATSSNYASPFVIDGRSDFTVIMDRRIVVGRNSDVVKMVRKTIKCNFVQTFGDSLLAPLPNSLTNQMFYAIFSDSVISSHPNFQCQSWIRYTDE